jgi:sugar phosphate isomerase/epimerase
MQNSRRSFIRQTSITLAGAAFFNNKIFIAGEYEYILGIQLYSVRDDMAANPAGTLQQLASIGYKYVEHANYENRKFYGYTANQFKDMLTGLGLQMKSGHTSLGKKHWNVAKKDFTDEWKYTVEDAAAAGQRYVISPWLDDELRKTKDGLLRFMEVFNKCGELCKKNGLRFGYHNHDFEFKEKLDGDFIYDIILSNTDPALVAQQIDTGNMYYVGGRAIEIIKKYPGRFELMHVKDEIKSEQGEMGGNYESTILGNGVVGLKQVIELAKEAGGTQYFIVEQESYQDMTPIDCATKNFTVMQGWGF